MGSRRPVQGTGVIPVPTGGTEDAVGRGVTAAIVTWNSRHVLPELLTSLGSGSHGGDAPHTVVVDNASDDGTLALVGRTIPDAVTVQMGCNAGYAAGINRAIEFARPDDDVLVLNPDVRLEPGMVRLLQQALHDPRVGIAVPRVVDPGGALLRTLRRDPTVARAWGEALLGGRLAGYVPRLGETVTARAAYSSTRDVDWASGAVMMISRRCLDDVGPWDEGFFLFSEETDFAMRCRRRGYAVRFVPQATAIHVGGPRSASRRLRPLLLANKVRLFARHHGRTSILAFWTALLVGELRRAATGRAAAHRQLWRNRPRNPHDVRSPAGGSR